MKLFNHPFQSDWQWFKNSPIQFLRLEGIVTWLWEQFFKASRAERKIWDKYKNLPDTKEVFRLHRQEMEKLENTRWYKIRKVIARKLYMIKFGSIDYIFRNLLE